MKIKIEKELSSVQKPQSRKLKISSDDPFSNIFINDMQYEKKGDREQREEQQKKEQQEREELEKAQKEIDSDDDQKEKNGDEESDAASSIGEKEDPSAW